MSDLFLSSGIEVDVAQLAREMRFTDYTNVQSGSAAGMTWAVSRVDDFGLWGPACDQASQTHALIGGRIALEEIEWATAERLPYKGGLAARHILAQWLERGAVGVAEYNGAALIVIIDERRGEAHVWTDRMGFYPAFAIDRSGVIVGSHPDVIAKFCAAAGRPLAIDDLTIAEFLRTGTSVHPNTYWRGVSHLDAASQFHLGPANGAGGLRKRARYWKPGFLDGVAPMTRDAFVATFADALRSAGRRRSLSRLGRTAVLLSAGADSRGVLAATQAPSDVHCYTYFDEPNEELRGAQKIAALAHAQHFPLRRSPDYYVANAEETVRLSCGMWSINSGHHAGFVGAIREQSNPGTLLTGCYADYFFKGLALNCRPLQFLGRNLPLYETSAYSHEFYQPHAIIEPRWSAEVDARLRDFAKFQIPVDPRLAEFARLSPACREADASGRLALWRTAPFDVFVADNDLLEAYGRLSIPDKVSGIAFGQAIARVTGPRMAAVPNNNFGASVGTAETGRVASFLLASAARKLKHAIGPRQPYNPNSVATPGSWPDFVRVAILSPLMRHWFEEIFQKPNLLVSYLHPSRRAWSLEEFATRDQFQLYRLITANLWLNRHGR